MRLTSLHGGKNVKVGCKEETVVSTWKRRKSCGPNGHVRNRDQQLFWHSGQCNRREKICRIRKSFENKRTSFELYIPGKGEQRCDHKWSGT